MRTPTIHPNGTKLDDLHARYLAAALRLEWALRALRECAPHPRDYETQDREAFTQARVEHEQREHRVQDVQREVDALFEHVDAAVRARS